MNKKRRKLDSVQNGDDMQMISRGDDMSRDKVVKENLVGGGIKDETR
jgi:hypothetical protein